MKTRHLLSKMIQRALESINKGREEPLLRCETGEEFLAAELGLDTPNLLPTEAKTVAKLLHYHKQALMIVVDMLQPGCAGTQGMNWIQILYYVNEIRDDLNV
jgi:hypothetical protein